jgi:hypothetical protein
MPDLSTKFVQFLSAVLARIHQGLISEDLRLMQKNVLNFKPLLLLAYKLTGAVIFYEILRPQCLLEYNFF